MLVLQRSNGMGSSQPPEGDGPFGYSFDPTTGQHDFLTFMEPPEPAPGQPLLSDTDSKLLGNFFESMEENFTFEGLNFSEDWLHLPPQFMGHTTSFGQQPSPALESPVHSLSAQFPQMMAAPSSLMPPPPPPTQVQPPAEQPSADVLAAATLLQNGSMSRPSTNGHDTMYGARGVPSSIGPPVGHLRHQPINEFRQEGRRMSQSQSPNEHDNTFTDMMFGSTARPPAPRGPPVDVQWGSDASFSRHQSFVPQSAKETSEAMINEHLAYMDCLEVSHSAANSRPSSPIHNGDGSPLKLKTRVPQLKQEDSEAPPRKRRKSKAKVDEEDDEELQAPPTLAGGKAAARKRKSKADVAPASSPTTSDAAGRRRKSTTAAASKAARENLSEEQKRENHIKSEQKRRTVIKEGFDDLCDLVPGLKGGGFSKSTMLTMAAEYLEEVIQGNQILQKQLNALDIH